MYVITPVPLSYDIDPSPPKAVTDTCALTSAALGPVYVNTPVLLSNANPVGKDGCIANEVAVPPDVDGVDEVIV